MRELVDLFSPQEENNQARSRMNILIYLIAAAVIIMVVGSWYVLAHADPVQLQASWYSRASLIAEGTWKAGKESRMANGQRFDENALTCAARLWPLGTCLLVRNNLNGKTVRVIVTDRIGKRFASTRIDLSRGAFERISDLRRGVCPVRVEVIQ